MKSIAILAYATLLMGGAAASEKKQLRSLQLSTPSTVSIMPSASPAPSLSIMPSVVSDMPSSDKIVEQAVSSVPFGAGSSMPTTVPSPAVVSDAPSFTEMPSFSDRLLEGIDEEA